MIVAYITSHGFGHAVRACEALRRLPPEIPLTIRSRVPETFLKSRLETRAFAYAPEAFDCGTLGPDSRRIDLLQTLEQIEPLLDWNDGRLDMEARWLAAQGARLVVSDVPAFPLAAARRARIPSILVANFTWVEIYRHLLDTEKPSPGVAHLMASVIQRMEEHYAEGDYLLIPGLDIPMAACREQIHVPFITRRGQSRKAELARACNFDPNEPIYLVYLGREGLADMQWENLARLRGLQLVGYAAPPEAQGLIPPLPENENILAHADVAASVDAVIGKAGYGICTECIATGTPLLYPPRPQFAESSAIARVMEQWGGGLAIGAEDFLALNWQPHLEQLLARRQRTEALDCTGGPTCADYYARIWRGEGLQLSEELKEN